MFGTRASLGCRLPYTFFQRRRLLRDSDLATEIADRHALRGLLQHRGDLLDRETLLHGTPPGPLRTDCAAESPWAWSENAGAPHEVQRLPPASRSGNSVLPE